MTEFTEPHKLTDERAIRSTILLFAAAYMVSYLTRQNFAAVISEMEAQTGFSRSLLSTAVTGSFVTYGSGQLVSGYLGDRIQPKKLLLIGLILTSTMNLLIPICISPYLMCAVWCINGFAQSLMWPPLVKLMVYFLNGEDYKQANFMTNCGSSTATVLIYLLSPFFISSLGWRSIFIVCGFCGLIMAVIWQKNCKDIELQPVMKKHSAKGEGLFSPMLFTILFVIILCGILRDGVTTWMPSYIAETYDLSNRLTILTGVVMPVFGVVCVKISIAIYRKMPDNPIRCAAIFYGIAGLSAFGISLISGQSAAVSITLTALLTGCMHGVNMMLISMLPPFFQKKGNISFVSGLLNSFVYIGSAISTYGIAWISETSGWNRVTFLWFIIAGVGTLLCILLLPSWKKFIAE